MEKSRKPILISLKPPSKVHSDEVLSKVSCFIDTAMKKQISWSSLALILDEMASTVDVSKQAPLSIYKVQHFIQKADF